MVEFKTKVINFIKNIDLFRKLDFNKYFYYFLLHKKNELCQFKININTKCLVLSHYPGAETKGLGGLIAQYPKNFEVLCFTNGSKMLHEYNPIESAAIKKQQFSDIMKTARVKGYKIFNIDSCTLKNHYSTFKKIDISEADYIFIPNIYDTNPDAIATLKHLKQLLKEKEYKQNLTLIMFESDFALNTFNYYENIDSIVTSKKRMLEEYYPANKFPNYANKSLGINTFRAIQCNCDYAEVFTSLSVQEFSELPMIYN